MMSCSVTMLVLVLLLALHHSTVTAYFNRDVGLIFDFYPAQKLTLPKGAKQKSTLVEGRMECVFECTAVQWCRSVNLQTTPQSNGLYVCELLSKDQFNNSMTPDMNYNHYSVQVGDQ